MSKLILARHGVTPYNEAGIWTGLKDIDMSDAGFDEVRQSAAFLSDYKINIAFSSALRRARNTARVILAAQMSPTIPLLETELLNEKDYGVFTGQNKQEVHQAVGDEAFGQIRRSWDYKIAEGESLADVHSRVLSVHESVVLPLLESDRTILVASHNNTLRAYVKELEDVPTDEANKIELGTAEVRVYDFNAGIFALEAIHAVGSVH